MFPLAVVRRPKSSLLLGMALFATITARPLPVAMAGDIVPIRAGADPIESALDAFLRTHHGKGAHDAALEMLHEVESQAPAFAVGGEHESPRLKAQRALAKTLANGAPTRGRDQDRRLFEAILVDERRHCTYSREFLVEVAGGEAEARRALRRVARWELGRRWLRAGRFVAERVYVALMLLLYVLAAPLALLVRLARPVRRGWLTAPVHKAIRPIGPSKAIAAPE